jgi:integrase
MARTGLRRGEAVALNWENIDLDGRIAKITRSASRVPGQGLQITPTKSAAGKRTLSLDPGTVVLLKHWRARQAEQALGMGAAFRDQGFIFTNLTGGALDPDHLSQAFKRHARAGGYPNIRLHDLRHFHAFGLIANNVHPKIVQDRLGHASAAFTMQVYGHGSEELQREAVERFATMLDA